MRHIILTVSISFLLLAGTAFAQMAAFQDSNGITGWSFQIGPNMGMYGDSTGRQGTFKSFGNQGMFQDNTGTSGMWQNIGPNQRMFTDNHGGQGQMFQNGPNMGMLNYQTPRGTTNGQYFQYGR